MSWLYVWVRQIYTGSMNGVGEYELALCMGKVDIHWLYVWSG